ncbi:hypothetical protein [Aquabacterium sp.]|uniref:hypothetical protein n=1 Tax=Aquabacterium TaxID=92793 RepID=UPI001DF94583|nr:hypothetical protein [Aquabacterium sp.]MBT9611217.1 hypothetical protein [Aquabacterium sp.]
MHASLATAGTIANGQVATFLSNLSFYRDRSPLWGATRGSLVPHQNPDVARDAMACHAASLN